MTLPRGLYDLVLTESVKSALGSLAPDEADVRELSPDELPERFIDALSAQLRAALSTLGNGEQAPGKTPLDLLNGLLAQVREWSGPNDFISAPPSVLRSVRRGGSIVPVPPDTGLAAPWLFTAGRGSPSLVSELRNETAGADRIDILVSFIKVSGVRKLMDILAEATAADAHGIGRTKLRVLTTTYMGATDQAALDQLARLNGCDVRVSLDGRRTRLHAKAWLFHRASGFGSAYVGSANLSGAALMGGLEWTVKFTERGQQALFERAKAHFDTLWLDDEFTPYHPEDAKSRSAVAAALLREGATGEGTLPHFFEIEAKPYQQDMLDQLNRERALGRNRNLLVAATGTGKTVVAALDYRATCEKLGHRPRLLFVAHRAQILRQARRTYREVLRDNSFGELLTGGVSTVSDDHLFATIDTVASRGLLASHGPEYWHTVVIDECHRLAASRFNSFVTAVRPAELLGLTATPERADGQSIEKYFSPRLDGSPAVELRLWDALDMMLLAPFEYYGCNDSTDFSEVPWSTAGERNAIDSLVRADHARARLVIREWARLTADPRRGRALVFCVSVAHAQFMTDQLNKAGLPALCVTGDTPMIEQLRAPRRLADGDVCALVTVDLYNEGIDIPSVDTVLLLRPTQSPVLFQQQIGRGVRLFPGKDSCLILDFVGQYRQDFRFDRLLSPLTGLTRNQLEDAVQTGFNALPPGCHIHLDPQSRAQVLRSLRTLTRQPWRHLSTELASYAAVRGEHDIPLGDFLREQKVDLADVYRSTAPSGWTTLKRSAGLLPSSPQQASEDALSRRLGSLLHLDDPEQLALLRRVSESKGAYQPDSVRERLRAQMLTYQVDGTGPARPFREFLDTLAGMPSCALELGDIADVLGSRTLLSARPIPGLESLPLQLHGAYRLREILTAAGYLTAERLGPMQAGVLALPESHTELLFVTLDKSTGYHDAIAYHDYAVSATRFHWQTQNSVGPTSPAGRRYIESATNGWRFQLFVRPTQFDAYRACGPAKLMDPSDISGARPMSITWTLDVPLPARLFTEFSVLRGQG